MGGSRRGWPGSPRQHPGRTLLCAQPPHAHTRPTNARAVGSAREGRGRPVTPSPRRLAAVHGAAGSLLDAMKNRYWFGEGTG